jgi:Transmembrane adaptor Erv26
MLHPALVLLNHYLWFHHFQRPPHPPHYTQNTASSSYDPYAAGQLASFNEIASFFGLCVWLVPFTLFVALSAGDNILPSMGSEYATGEGSSFVSPGLEPGKGKASGGRGVGGMAKQVIDGVREWVGEMGGLVAGSGGGRRGAGGGGEKRF